MLFYSKNKTRGGNFMTNSKREEIIAAMSSLLEQIIENNLSKA